MQANSYNDCKGLRFGGLLLLLAALACQDAAAPSLPDELNAVAPSEQDAVAGQAVAVAPAVRVLDQRGRPLEGIEVRFAVTGGGGQIAVSRAVTDRDGRASAGEWILGPRAGANTVAASVATLPPVTFTASGLAGAPARLHIVSGDAQSATVASPLPVPVRVRVTDANDNPVANIAVSFVASPEHGGVASSVVKTGADGVADAGPWLLGPRAGEQTLEARVDGLAPAVFHAEGFAGPAAMLEISSGNDQTAIVGTAVPLSPTVRVLDAHGNPVSGAEVRFVVVTGDGAVDGPQSAAASDNSDAIGVAQVVRWVLGTRAGMNVLRAELVQSGASVSFTATGMPDAPANVAKVGGDGQTVAPGSEVAIPPAVRVTDRHGNPVPDATVTFTAGADGSVGAPSSVSDGNGIASAGSWRVGSTTGTHTLVAALPGGPSVQFTATAVTGSGGSGGTGGSGGSGGGSGGSGGGSGGGSYDIGILFTGSPTASQQNAFYMAAGRWATVIRGELPNVQVSIPANACGIQHPAISETVDDLLILVSVTNIDGPGNVLGSAGPCYVRSAGGLTVVGAMRLDAADLDFLESNGRLEDVLAHEMGHIIGIGTRWGSHLVGAGTADPHFTGAAALDAFLGAGGASYPGTPVPVENTGGPGTRDGHWRESVFHNELMTGWINLSGNPLSAVTVAALEDIGYVVDYAGAEGFSIGGANAAAEAETPLARFEIRENPLGITPIVVDARGRPVPGSLIRR